MDSTTEDYMDQLDKLTDEYDKKYSDKDLLKELTNLRQLMRATGETARDDMHTYAICKLLTSRDYGFYFGVMDDLDDYEHLRYEHTQLQNKYDMIKNLLDAAKKIIDGLVD